ncbi:uncharacterized protein [Oscarella lobularis]|uniref:uncharacterized protein isoform X2 n=1 Tax=Oscarella lobularis TaxID=121494 RepID=UPI003313D802
MASYDIPLSRDRNCHNGFFPEKSLRRSYCTVRSREIDMGNHLPHFGEGSLSRRRKNLIERFDGQKFLILGRPGCGKSSLVNSFNYVINLVDPRADYDEIAQVGASTGETKTRHLTKYDFRKEMYACLKGDERRKAPAFFDLVGLPNQATLSDLISKLADGKIEEGTDMISAVSEDDPSYRENLGKEHREPQKSMAAWTIILVLSANEPFPEGLATDIKEAIGQIEELKERSKDLRIFAFITKLDKITDKDRRDQKVEDITQNFKMILNVPKHRVMQITNFTADDDYDTAKMKYRPNKNKELGILNAFGKILTRANCLDPFEAT